MPRITAEEAALSTLEELAVVLNNVEDDITDFRSSQLGKLWAYVTCILCDLSRKNHTR